MKMKKIVTALLISFVLASCAPAATVVPTETAAPTITFTPIPTETAAPTPTFTPIPSTPTITPTPAPENISDVKDFSVWVDEFVHAFGGKITINGVEMNTDQLVSEVSKNSESFIQMKNIDGNDYLFLVINGVPLAMREGAGQWQEATSRKMADLIGVTVGGPIADPYFATSQSENVVDAAIGREFNSAYLLKSSWHQTEPNQNDFDFSGVNNAIIIAVSYNMKIEGDHIIYSHSNFRYTYLKDMKHTSSSEIMPIVLNHVRTLMTELKGKIDVITPMNEVRPPSELNEDDTEPYDWLTKIMGGNFEYMVDIYRTVREIDPNVALLYNETRNETTNNGNLSRGTKYTKTILGILERDNLVDGVGVQFHIDVSRNLPDPADVTKTLQSYKLPVYITEFDISGDPSTQKKAELYNQYVTLILNTGVCKQINFWDANAHFFDNQMKPNSILYAVRQALFDYLK